jgi:hypothetical protein
MDVHQQWWTARYDDGFIKRTTFGMKTAFVG